MQCNSRCRFTLQEPLRVQSGLLGAVDELLCVSPDTLVQVDLQRESAFARDGARSRTQSKQKSCTVMMQWSPGLLIQQTGLAWLCRYSGTLL